MQGELTGKALLRQKVLSIIPKKGKNLTEQVTDCFLQAENEFLKSGVQKWQVIKQTYFINACTPNQYSEIQSQINTLANSFFAKFVPLTVVPQPPICNALVYAEFIVAEGIGPNEIIEKSVSGLKYLVVKSIFGDLVVSGGLGNPENMQDILTQCKHSFHFAKNILDNETLSFSDVIRQWNYIGNIVGNSGCNQHYQVFNDVRSEYYSTCQFNNGYPAATGIGMEIQGIIIEIMALHPANNVKISAIKSPVQTDAHQYTSKVLADNFLPVATTKTTPKFERAKAICSEGNSMLFVSGTAAIKGELSASDYSAAEQTDMTLNNIYSLISKENLNRHQLLNFNASILSFRVYVKNLSDSAAVREVMNRKAPNIPTILVKADVCRPELLVEIEAVAEIL